MPRGLRLAMLLCLITFGGCDRGGPGEAGERPRTVEAARDKGASGSVKREVEKKVPSDAIEALENADSFVLYSLDPTPRRERTSEGVQGWPVLGQVEVGDPAVRSRLVDSLWNGVAESDGTVANCFNPRHAIRVTHKGKTIDYVICFECLQVQMTEGRRRGIFFNHPLAPIGIRQGLDRFRRGSPLKGRALTRRLIAA